MEEVQFLPKMRESVAVQFEATASQEIEKAAQVVKVGVRSWPFLPDTQ